MDLVILKTIHDNPGIKVQGICDELKDKYISLTLNIIRNTIKREIKNYIEFKGSKKTGGYYIKNKK